MAAAAVGGVAAFAAGTLGLVTLSLVLGALAVGFGRGRGWALSKLSERPRLFVVLSGFYIPIFVIDLAMSSRGNPIHALIRLVAFLLVGEVLSGDVTRAHRPILMGLLLLVSSAAETTEIWFAIPLVAFAVASTTALLDATLIAHQPAGAAAPVRRLAPISVIVSGSLCVGTVAFFAIPRLGAGWGRELSAVRQAAPLETGLADTVHLGAVGRVKKRRSVAFLARVRGRFFEPDTVYWRVRTYSTWTGEGWSQDESERGAVLLLPAGIPVDLPGRERTADGSHVSMETRVEIETKLDRSPALVAPGRAGWIRTPRESRVRIGLDGSLSDPDGDVPRRYEVGVHLPRRPDRIDTSTSSENVLGEDPRPFPGDPDAKPARDVYFQTGPLEPQARDWALRIARGASDPRKIARAFVADLSPRAYSLDTSAIDPVHPITSFLGGAPAHCEYFASAMALGLRARGIAARVVGGYLGAEQGSSPDELVVREAQAHLWVEAYFPGIGWTAFDPTPEAGRGPPSSWSYSLRDAWESLVRTWDGAVIGLSIADQADLLLRVRELALGVFKMGVRAIPILAFAAPVALILGAVHFRTRRRQGRSPIRSGAPLAYRRFLTLAARCGIHLRPVETAREFAFRAGRSLGDPGAVWLISRLYERERFGGLVPTRIEERAASEALERIRLLSRRSG